MMSAILKSNMYYKQNNLYFGLMMKELNQSEIIFFRLN